MFPSSSWPGEPTQTGPSPRPLSPPAGPVPGTPTEREVDDAARKSHEEPVTLSVQLQPYDPPCRVGCPLPTAPRVRPEGVRGAGLVRVLFPWGGARAAECSPRGWASGVTMPHHRTVRLLTKPLSVSHSCRNPRWSSHPIPTSLSTTSRPTPALQGGPVLTGRGCRHQSLPIGWARGPQAVPLGAAPSALSHHWSRGTELLCCHRDQPHHPRLPGSVGPWRDRPRVRASGPVDACVFQGQPVCPGTQPGPFPQPRVSFFAPFLPFPRVLPPANVIYVVGSKEKRLRGKGSGQHFTAPYLLVRVSRGWRVAGGTAGSSSG